MRIDWSPVEDNSSSLAAVIEFARGASLRYAKGLVWDPRMKRLLNRLGQLPVKQARARARAYMHRKHGPNF